MEAAARRQPPRSDARHVVGAAAAPPDRADRSVRRTHGARGAAVAAAGSGRDPPAPWCHRRCSGPTRSRVAPRGRQLPAPPADVAATTARRATRQAKADPEWLPARSRSQTGSRRLAPNGLPFLRSGSHREATLAPRARTRSPRSRRRLQGGRQSPPSTSRRATSASGLACGGVEELSEHTALPTARRRSGGGSRAPCVRGHDLPAPEAPPWTRLRLRRCLAEAAVADLRRLRERGPVAATVDALQLALFRPTCRVAARRGRKARDRRGCGR